MECLCVFPLGPFIHRFDYIYITESDEVITDGASAMAFIAEI